MSIFNQIPIKKVKRTPHRLNNSVKFSTQFGIETPTVCRKVVPGDIIGYQHAHRIDFAPLSTKLLQEFRVKSEAFFVPTRILWKGFEEFFAAFDATTDEEAEIIHPFFNPLSTSQALFDILTDLIGDDPIFTPTYMGNVADAVFGSKSLLRTLYGNIVSYIDKDSVPIRRNLDVLRVFAYYRIMAEYYLDENLQADFIDILSVSDFVTQYQDHAGDMSGWLANILFKSFVYNGLGRFDDDVVVADFLIDSYSNIDAFLFYWHGFIFRNYPKDYFTSALPWKQKGASVMIPQLSGQDVSMYIDSEYDIGSGLLQDNPTNFVVGEKVGSVVGNQQQVNLGLRQYVGDDDDNTYLRLRTVVGKGVTSIEDFRTAYQLQQWLERNARGGTRYKEQILSHFGVKTKDSRLDRPEFLLGTTDVISHGDVFTTFQDEDGTGVPAESVTRLSGAGRSMFINYKVSEHGYFINLFSLFPKASYCSGVNREALELDRFDYFWPEFEHLGEQEIVQDELVAGMGGEVFGYTPRYAQYKCALNDVFGEFVGNLATFTDTRFLDSDTAFLCSKFIQIDPVYNQLNRIFNVVNSSYDKIYVDFYNNLFMLRPMSYFGTPRLVL